MTEYRKSLVDLTTRFYTQKNGPNRLTEDEYDNAQLELRALIEECEATIEATVQDVDLPGYYLAMPPIDVEGLETLLWVNGKDARPFVTSVIQEIVIAPVKRRGGNRFDPDRVTINFVKHPYRETFFDWPDVHV